MGPVSGVCERKGCERKFERAWNRGGKTPRFCSRRCSALFFSAANYQKKSARGETRQPCKACGGRKEAGSTSPRCIGCREKHADLYHDYGVTRTELQEMQIAQGNMCFCKDSLPGLIGEDRRVVPDHCHKTGRIRGIIHQGCNVGLGQFGDDPERVFLAEVHLCDLDLRELCAA